MGIVDDNINLINPKIRPQENNATDSSRRNDISDLIYALERVLYCEQCRGHGKIWRRGGPDVRCACRSEAVNLLEQIKGEQ